jgi:XTP/dITP diphosphohydrolase
MYMKLGEPLVFASTNRGKLAEARNLLSGLPVSILPLADFPAIEPPDETGHTFRENSELKAAYYARLTRCWAVADDSGLEVACLGGEPGVRSARFGLPEMNYSDRIKLLLTSIAKANSDDQSARFVCAISVADPTGKVTKTFEQYCTGRIVDAPRGDNGFGYDPVFAPDEFAQTFGELPDAIKQGISHRSRALALFRAYLWDSLSAKA